MAVAAAAAAAQCG
jgi:hypothetical protein